MVGPSDSGKHFDGSGVPTLAEVRQRRAEMGNGARREVSSQSDPTSVCIVYTTAMDFVGLLPVAAFRDLEAANAFMLQPGRQQALQFLDLRMGIKVMLLQDACRCGQTKDEKGFCPSCDELKF